MDTNNGLITKPIPGLIAKLAVPASIGMFLEAIKDLCEQTSESRKRYREVTFAFLRLFDHEKFGLSAQSMLRSEANLRELLREMIFDLYPDKKNGSRYGRSFTSRTWSIKPG